MTAHEILLESMRLRREDVTDTALLNDYNAVALVAMNEAQRDICTEINPEYTDDVALDSSKRFDATDLTYTLGSIRHISQYEDYTSAATWGVSVRYDYIEYAPGAFTVPDAEASATVYVKYSAIPADLVNTYPVAVEGHAAGSDATSPSLIPTQFHRALCFKVASALFRMDGRLNDAMFWEAQYQSFKESLRVHVPQEAVDSYYTV